MSIFEINESWKKILKEEFEKAYFQNLESFLQEEKENFTIYPKEELIFSAFNRTPFESLKVVLIGQDPYHGPGQANGLSFSVNNGIRKPPSLINIFKELQTDLGLPIPESGNLEPWADQGVLLLNATLTVRASEAGSHQKKGWENFTDKVIQKISEEKENVVFLLWGNFAQGKAELIDANKHLILKAAHPSPLARGAFFGSKPFSQTNTFLKAKGLGEIDWKL
ncbi:MAG: uracil-DNA glycosylase [Flavobacteriia bacterium]|jgi:uracil-DNA glycosylase